MASVEFMRAAWQSLNIVATDALKPYAPVSGEWAPAVEGVTVGAVTSLLLLVAAFWHDASEISRLLRRVLLFACCCALALCAGVQRTLVASTERAAREQWQQYPAHARESCNTSPDTMLEQFACSMVTAAAGPSLVVTRQEVQIVVAACVYLALWLLARSPLRMMYPSLALAMLLQLVMVPWVMLGGSSSVPEPAQQFVAAVFSADTGAAAAAAVAVSSAFATLAGAASPLSIDSVTLFVYGGLVVLTHVGALHRLVRGACVCGPPALLAAAHKSLVLAVACYVLGMGTAHPLMLPLYWVLHADHSTYASMHVHADRAMAAMLAWFGPGDRRATLQLGIASPAFRRRAQQVGVAFVLCLIGVALAQVLLPQIDNLEAAAARDPSGLILAALRRLRIAAFGAKSFAPTPLCMSLSAPLSPGSEQATLWEQSPTQFLGTILRPANETSAPLSNSVGVTIMSVAAAARVVGVSIGKLLLLGVQLVWVSLPPASVDVTLTPHVSTWALQDFAFTYPWQWLRAACVITGLLLITLGTPRRGILSAMEGWLMQVRSADVPFVHELLDEFVFALSGLYLCARIVLAGIQSLSEQLALSHAFTMQSVLGPTAGVDVAVAMLLLLAPRAHVSPVTRFIVSVSQTCLGALALTLSFALRGAPASELSGGDARTWCLTPLSAVPDELLESRIFWMTLAVGTVVKTLRIALAKPAPDAPAEAQEFRAARKPGGRRRRGSEAPAGRQKQPDVPVNGVDAAANAEDETDATLFNTSASVADAHAEEPRPPQGVSEDHGAVPGDSYSSSRLHEAEPYERYDAVQSAGGYHLHGRDEPAHDVAETSWVAPSLLQATAQLAAWRSGEPQPWTPPEAQLYRPAQRMPEAQPRSATRYADDFQQDSTYDAGLPGYIAARDPVMLPPMTLRAPERRRSSDASSLPTHFASATAIRDAVPSYSSSPGLRARAAGPPAAAVHEPLPSTARLLEELRHRRGSQAGESVPLAMPYMGQAARLAQDMRQRAAFGTESPASLDYATVGGYAAHVPPVAEYFDDAAEPEDMLDEVPVMRRAYGAGAKRGAGDSYAAVGDFDDDGFEVMSRNNEVQRSRRPRWMTDALPSHLLQPR